MHEEHRKAAGQYELAAQAYVLLPNTMKKGTAWQAAGMQNAQRSFRSAPTNLQKKPRPSLGR